MALSSPKACCVVSPINVTRQWTDRPLLKVGDVDVVAACRHAPNVMPQVAIVEMPNLFKALGVAIHQRVSHQKMENKFTVMLFHKEGSARGKQLLIGRSFFLKLHAIDFLGYGKMQFHRLSQKEQDYSTLAATLAAVRN